MKCLPIVLLLASFAVAQQPTTRPSEVDSLRTQVAELRSVIAMLRKENSDLKLKLAARDAKPQPAATSAPIVTAIKAHKVVEGMTREQVAQSLNHLRGVPQWNVGREKSSSTDGEDVEVWRITYGGYPAALVRQVTVTYGKDGAVAHAVETVADTAFAEPDYQR